MESLADKLGSFAGTMFQFSAIAFLLVNVAAATAFILTRDRKLVNRWTGHLVALDILLLGTGVGAPAVASAMRLVVSAVSASQTTSVQTAVVRTSALGPNP